MRFNPRRRPFPIIAAALALAAAASAGQLAAPGGTEPRASAPVTPPTGAGGSAADELPPLRPRPKVVVAVPPGEAPPAGASVQATTPSRPASDAEVRAELAAFRTHLNGAKTQTGPEAKILPDGTAVAPRGAPPRVVAVIAAANEIATKPYKWGGGHGAWKDSGYDCSGSVSFALAGAGLLDSPLTSGGFMRWGERRVGRWITIYTNPGHMFMVVAGLRFDTSGANGGTRWQTASRSTSGLQPRSLPGL